MAAFDTNANQTENDLTAAANVMPWNVSIHDNSLCAEPKMPPQIYIHCV
jgi:hypothetical protein